MDESSCDEISNRKNLGQIQCGIMIRDLRLSQYHNATRGGGIIIHHFAEDDVEVS